MKSIEELDVSHDLEQQGVSGISIEGNTIVVIHNQVPIRFDIIQASWFKTIKGFQSVAKDFITDKKLIQAIIVDLNKNYSTIIGMRNTQTTNERRSDHNVSDEIDATLLNDELINAIPDKNYAEFVIRTIKKTVKMEDVLVRQVLYAGISAYTLDPINLGIIAPTSEGKTYVVTQVIKYFPRGDIWSLGSMSTKVLVRQKGTLVDRGNNPIAERVDELKKQIRLLGNSRKNLEEKEKLSKELEVLTEDPKTLIDLSGKILVFLEPPHHELWNLLKPILSHDVPEIEFPYVDKTDKDGILTKKVVVKGWPACIFCSAKDESGWEIWPEIQSRFLITSPNMNKQKYFESNVLIAQKKGLPNLVQQYVIVSDQDIDLARKCIRLLKRQIKDLYTSNNADYHKNTNAVWIPYQEILGGSLSSNRGIDNRVTARIFSLLNIISLAKQNLRSKMVYGTEKLVVASLEDLGEVLRITQNISGMPTHKIQFYADIFMPLYNSEDGPKVKDDKAEMRTGVTTTQLREYYKSQTGKTLSSNNIKQTYLNELLNNGYIDEEDSLIDKRGKIYFPLIELPQDKITNYNKLEQVDDFLQCSRIILPKYYSKVPDNWLKLEILSLLKYPIRLDKFQLIDQDNKETCICQFVESYEKKLKLSGFFTNSESTKLRTEIFGNVKFIGKNYGENYNNLSIQDKVLQFDNSSSQVSTCEATI